MSRAADRIAQRIATNLTPAQQAAVYVQGRSVVVACPGSGKTRVVGYRLAWHLARSDANKVGIAVISFTNNAVREVLTQLDTLGLGTDIPYPHFLGTIDSFLTQHLFRPYGHLVMGCDVAPEIVPPEQKSLVDSFLSKEYRSISLGRRRPPHQVHLHDLDFTPDGKLDTRRAFEGLPSWAIMRFPETELYIAKQKCAAAGLASYSDAVYWSYKLISASEHSWVADGIKRRYKHWIVDEAQDTSELHARILEALWGTNDDAQVLIVGDPDQAIYEWNQAQPDYIPNLLQSRTAVWQRFSLGENWRSSQLICDATHVFRNQRLFPQPAVAVGQDAQTPVQPVLLGFLASQYHLLPTGMQLLWQMSGCTPRDAPQLAVVAWTRETVGKLLGQTRRSIPATETGRLLCSVLFQHRQGDEGKAYRTLEQVMCQLLFGRPSAGVDHHLLPPHMSTVRWRSCLLTMLSQLTRTTDSTTLADYIQQGRQLTQETFRRLQLAPKDNLGNKIRLISSDEGQHLLSSFQEDESEQFGVKVSTIHKVKGTSFDGLMLVGGYDPASRSSDVTEWLKAPSATTGICREPRRIAYVAMTRPRKLLVVALPVDVGKAVLNHREWQKCQFVYQDLDTLLTAASST